MGKCVYHSYSVDGDAGGWGFPSLPHFTSAHWSQDTLGLTVKEMHKFRLFPVIQKVSQQKSVGPMHRWWVPNGHFLKYAVITGSPILGPQPLLKELWGWARGGTSGRLIEPRKTQVIPWWGRSLKTDRSKYLEPSKFNKNELQAGEMQKEGREFSLKGRCAF